MTTITHDGKTLNIQQEAYPATDGSNTYWAHATDDAGNDYRVIWDVINPDADDGSDACDWSNYRVVKQ